MEMICASQAIYLEQAENEVSSKSRERLTWIRSIVPPLREDTSVSEEIERLANAILTDDAWM
jgi:histidine ammonia-lyase